MSYWLVEEWLNFLSWKMVWELLVNFGGKNNFYSAKIIFFSNIIFLKGIGILVT